MELNLIQSCVQDGVGEKLFFSFFRQKCEGNLKSSVLWKGPSHESMCAVLCVKRNVHQRKAKQCVKLAGQKQQLKKGQTAFQKHKSEKKNKTTEDKSKCEGSEHYN